MAMMVVRHCPECIYCREKPKPETLTPQERPIALGGRWHIDGLQLQRSGGYDHLMVAVDAATKYVILQPSSGESASAASNILMEIVRRFGRPLVVTTDHGRAFNSALFDKTCEGLFVVHQMTGIGRARANGMVERVNRTIRRVATFICGGDGKQWHKFIGEIEYAINTRINNVTGYSPYELVYGRKPPGPTYTDNIVGETEDWVAEDNIRILRKRIEVLQQLAHRNQVKASKKQVSYHDAHAKSHTFAVGDKVYVYRGSAAERGVTSKLSFKWDGPYTITEELGGKTYNLRNDETNQPLGRSYHAGELYKEPEV